MVVSENIAYFALYLGCNVAKTMWQDRDCIAHNMKEMELLYKKFYVLLYRYAQTFLEDEDESKDVVGDVFQRLWESWQATGEEMEAPSSSFLYIAVRNRCLDKLRHNKACDNYASLVKATESFVTDNEVEEFEKRISKLSKAIDSLPSHTQMVLRSVYFQRLTYKETAAQLGMSENMVHKHMAKAFRLLREMSSEYNYIALLLLCSVAAIRL